jgi:hypothetical protein
LLSALRKIWWVFLQQCLYSLHFLHLHLHLLLLPKVLHLLFVFKFWMEEKCPLSYSQRWEKLGEFSFTSKCLFIFIFFSSFFYFFFFIIFIIFFSSSRCRSNAHQATLNVKSSSTRMSFHPPSSFSSSSSSSPPFSPSIYSSSYAFIHVFFARKKLVELLSTSKKA